MIYVTQIKNAVELQQFNSVQDSTLGKLDDLHGDNPKIGVWVVLFTLSKSLHVWGNGSHIDSYNHYTYVNMNKICSELTKL
jgi:hypothetical protein